MKKTELEQKLNIIKQNWEGEHVTSSSIKFERSMDIDMENNQVLLCITYTQEDPFYSKSLRSRCTAELDKVNEEIREMEFRKYCILPSDL